MTHKRIQIIIICLMLLLTLCACALTVEIGVIDENDALATAQVEDSQWARDVMATARASDVTDSVTE